jgi:hypothetical protein
MAMVVTASGVVALWRCACMTELSGVQQSIAVEFRV